MLALTAKLLPILLVDIANPVLFALLVYAAGSSRPLLNSWSLLIGHSVAYFAAGILVSFGVEQIAAALENPQAIDYAIGGVVGILLVCVFFFIRRGEGEQAEEPDWELTPWRCFAVGATANFIGIPFALPYFGAVDMILLADLGMANSLLALGIYNLGYALFFAIVPLSVMLLGDGAKPMLEKVNVVLSKVSEFVLPWLILLLGSWLAYESARYFLTHQ